MNEKLSEGAPSEEQRARFRAGAEALADDLERVISEEQIAIEERRAHTARHTHPAFAAGVAPQPEEAARSIAAALCDEVITIYEGNVGTHGPECYRWHAGCLALRVRQALAPQEPDDRHWSDKAASTYPGDEYENYPLRQAFGRGYKAALAAQPEPNVCDPEKTDIQTVEMSVNRDKLIAELRKAADAFHDQPGWLWACELVSLAADALAAQPVLAPEKVAEVLLRLMREEAMLFENGSEEWIAESDPVECLPPLARALCEAAKRGELS